MGWVIWCVGFDWMFVGCRCGKMGVGSPAGGSGWIGWLFGRTDGSTRRTRFAGGCGVIHRSIQPMTLVHPPHVHVYKTHLGLGLVGAELLRELLLVRGGVPFDQVLQLGELHLWGFVGRLWGRGWWDDGMHRMPRPTPRVASMHLIGRPTTRPDRMTAVLTIAISPANVPRAPRGAPWCSISQSVGPLRYDIE